MGENQTESDYIESVLADHEIDLRAVMRDPEANAFGYTMACACGFRYDPDPDVDHHRRHLADVLAAALSLPPGEGS